MIMRSKAMLLKKLVLSCLFLSFILFTSAVPSSRSLKSSLEDISVPQLVAHQEEFQGRMDFETNDYPDPGPNRGHDPKVPGTA